MRRVPYPALDVPAWVNHRLRERLLRRVRSWLAWPALDWRGARYAPFGIALGTLSALVTVAYYANRPGLQLDPDTAAYVMDAHRIMSGGGLVDPARLPGYPLLMALALALCLRHPRERSFWLVAVALLALFMTRPDLLLAPANPLRPAADCPRLGQPRAWRAAQRLLAAPAPVVAPTGFFVFSLVLRLLCWPKEVI